MLSHAKPQLWKFPAWLSTFVLKAALLRAVSSCKNPGSLSSLWGVIWGSAQMLTKSHITMRKSERRLLSRKIHSPYGKYGEHAALWSKYLKEMSSIKHCSQWHKRQTSISTESDTVNSFQVLSKPHYISLPHRP